MLPAFASVDDLAARIKGGISEGDEPRAQAALDDASNKVRAEGKPWVDDEGELDLPTGADAWRADIVFRVTLACAMRVFDNPDGVTQETLGPYSESKANASIDAYLTSQERRDIRRAAGRSSIGAVPITRGPLETARCASAAGTQYLDVDPPGEPIPFVGEDGW